MIRKVWNMILKGLSPNRDVNKAYEEGRAKGYEEAKEEALNAVEVLKTQMKGLHEKELRQANMKKKRAMEWGARAMLNMLNMKLQAHKEDFAKEAEAKMVVEDAVTFAELLAEGIDIRSTPVQFYLTKYPPGWKPENVHSGWKTQGGWQDTGFTFRDFHAGPDNNRWSRYRGAEQAFRQRPDPPKKDPTKLSNKQQEFIDRYIKENNCNAEQARIWSEKLTKKFIRQNKKEMGVA